MYIKNNVFYETKLAINDLVKCPRIFELYFLLCLEHFDSCK